MTRGGQYNPGAAPKGRKRSARIDADWTLARTNGSDQTGADLAVAMHRDRNRSCVARSSYALVIYSINAR